MQYVTIRGSFETLCKSPCLSTWRSSMFTHRKIHLRLGQFPPNVTSQPARQVEAGQTNVMIDRVKTRDVEAAVRTKISSEDPQKSVEKLESDVRQACAGCLLTFANRLRPNAEKRLNLTLLLGPGYHKVW